MLMPELTAEAQDVFALEPCGVIAPGEILAVPHPAAGILGVNVHGHHAVSGAFGIDLHRRRRSSNLWEGRYGFPLPPVPQPVEVTLSGYVAAQVAGSAKGEVPGLCWQRARGCGAAQTMAGNQAADIRLARTYAVTYGIVVGAVQVPVLVEFVIEFAYGEVVVYDLRHGGIKSNRIQPVGTACVGVVAVGFLGPDGGNHRAKTDVPRIACRGAPAADGAGGQIDLVHNSAGVFVLQDAGPHQVTGYQPGDGIGLLEVVAFIHEKEEGLVLHDWPTQTAAKAVVNPDTARLSRLVQLPAIGVVVSVLVVLIQGAMPGVGSTAGDHLHLAA